MDLQQERNPSLDDQFIANTIRMVTSEPGNPTEKSVALLFGHPQRNVYVYPEGDFAPVVRSHALQVHLENGYPPPQISYVLGMCRVEGCKCGGRLNAQGSIHFSGGFVTEELGTFTLDELEEVLKAILLRVEMYYRRFPAGAL